MNASEYCGIQETPPLFNAFFFFDIIKKIEVDAGTSDGPTYDASPG